MNRAGIGTRIALSMLAITALVLVIIGVGVLRVGADAFTELMMKTGDTAAEAHAMFDTSVSLVLVAAAAIASVAAVVLALLLARRLAGPIVRLAGAAHGIAAGNLRTRVPEEGPPELRTLAAAYNTMAEQLARQEAVRHEFVVNASHELRTPLTNLQGYLEALRDGVLPPERAIFESLGEEVDRITRLAASLDVLAGATGRTEPRRTLDAAAVIRTAVDLMTPAFTRGELVVETRIRSPLMVVARPDDLSQVLANLLQNAARYTPRGGRVRITAEERPGEIRVTVANTGPPIPAEDLPRLWERFYRVEKSRDRARGGAGIGLAIVRQLVEAGGGRVGASSDAAWTTFWFTIPVAPEPGLSEATGPGDR
jgi:signal transduction histidine kinase